MKIMLTDHALLRYLDRVSGYDIEAVRREIASKELKATAAIIGGNGRIPVGDNKHMFVLKDGRIVSVVPK